MIIVKIIGGLGNQIAQYSFAKHCADRLGVPLKLDVSAYRDYKLHAYGLDRFAIQAEQATDAEINAAKSARWVQEHSLLFDPNIPPQIRDGSYLDGYWGDYRYHVDGLSRLRKQFQPCQPLATANAALLTRIQSTESVSLHIQRGDDDVTNPNCVLMPLTYYEDALEEILNRIPNAHVYVFSDDLAWVEAHLQVPCPHTFVRGNDASRNVEDLQLMRACRHHIVANSSFSCWAALLGEPTGLTIAPQQYFKPDDPYLRQAFGRVDQPVWPPQWLAMPLRNPVATEPAYLGIAGGASAARPIRVGVWNYYEELTTDGFIFKHANASIGHNLLKPWCELYAYGQAHGIHFVTLDQVSGPEDLDAVIFQDRPRDHPMVARLLDADIPKYLCLFETEVIKPDNWDPSFHARFDRVFTWSDPHVDHRRFIKLNSVIDPESPYDFEVLKTAFHERKLCTLIAGAKLVQHPNELYSERIRAIHWFQTHAPEDFEFYGIGWNAALFPGYRGPVKNKLATLARYRFAICYENARNYPGYITEKILDCFRAGVVPVYLGAPNIEQWIPQDCFIDRNHFNSMEELHAYLVSMDIETYGAYMDRIRDFLASSKAYPFSTECFITTLTSFLARDVKTKRGESPRMSVAIPTYNYGKFLGLAIESVLAQEVEGLEVLVFDNASTDSTHDVLAKYAEDPRIRCMRNTRNIGGYYNWRNAYWTMTGSCITVLCADDFFLPGHLSRILEVMDAHPQVSVAYCPCVWVNEASKPTQVMNHPGHASGDYIGGRNEVADLLTYDCYITPSAAVIRRDAFDAIGMADETLKGAGDWDLWIRIAEKTPDFAFLKEPKVCYRIHSGQDTVTQVAQASILVDHIEILWKALERGSLPLFQAKAAEVLRLLESKFNLYPREQVSHLEPHLQAFRRLLSNPAPQDFHAERVKTYQRVEALCKGASELCLGFLLEMRCDLVTQRRALQVYLSTFNANDPVICFIPPGSPLAAEPLPSSDGAPMVAALKESDTFQEKSRICGRFRWIPSDAALMNTWSDPLEVRFRQAWMSVLTSRS